jgi:hypothetical protein
MFPNPFRIEGLQESEFAGEFWTIEEIAEKVGLSPATVTRDFESAGIPAVYIGGRPAYPFADVKEYVNLKLDPTIVEGIQWVERPKTAAELGHVPPVDAPQWWGYLLDIYVHGVPLARYAETFDVTGPAVKSALESMGVLLPDLTSEQVENVIEEYENGVSLGEIARRQGLAPTVISGVLYRAGVRRLRRRGLPEHLRKRVYEQYRRGEDVKAIAKEFGRQKSSIPRIAGAYAILYPERLPVEVSREVSIAYARGHSIADIAEAKDLLQNVVFQDLFGKGQYVSDVKVEPKPEPKKPRKPARRKKPKKVERKPVAVKAPKVPRRKFRPSDYTIDQVHRLHGKGYGVGRIAHLTGLSEKDVSEELEQPGTLSELPERREKVAVVKRKLEEEKTDDDLEDMIDLYAEMAEEFSTMVDQYAMVKRYKAGDTYEQIAKKFLVTPRIVESAVAELAPELSPIPLYESQRIERMAALGIAPEVIAGVIGATEEAVRGELQRTGKGVRKNPRSSLTSLLLVVGGAGLALAWWRWSR